MGLILELVKECDVRWVELGEVAEIGTGSFNRKDETENGQYPFYVRSKHILKSDNFQFNETAIIIPGEGGIGDIFHYIEGKYALHQRAYRIHILYNNLMPKFLYYFMSSYFKQYILIKSVGATSISIRKPMLENFKIPIPPLDTQSKIVQILDNFTELTAELTAELDLRKKQYEYYRDKLLSFDSNVKWVELGEVVLATKNINWQETDLAYKYIELTSVDRDNHSIIKTCIINSKNAPSRAKKIILENDVIFATTRPTQQRVCLINDKFSQQIVSTGFCVLRANINKINPKWIFYNILSSNFKKYVEVNESGSAYPSISDNLVKKFKIPLPPLETQQKIVNILDKFNTLANSLEQGLPKEIELRVKQYEYYRDKLLDFKKP